MDYGPLKVFSGTANPGLAQEIVDYLEIPLGRIYIRRFADGEIYVRYEENARGVDAFVVQPLCHPVNENLMELLIMIDALRRASAGRITAVIPYYAYARQDRKSAPREPISARLVADLLTVAGIHRVLTMDLDA
ncbi:MAG: ribose-phosphate diphosphokinase, partial [Armatimonadota bacterium]|nr:ribose-phosphate diphosphokinase [Armatimonadota bacterium]